MRLLFRVKFRLITTYKKLINVGFDVRNRFRVDNF